jgi:hypothetical protein
VESVAEDEVMRVLILLRNFIQGTYARGSSAPDVEVGPGLGLVLLLLLHFQTSRLRPLLGGYCHSGHEQIKKGEWDVCAATADAYDVKNKASYSTSTCNMPAWRACLHQHACCLPANRQSPMLHTQVYGL